MLGLDAASTGRRGPGQAGSARVFPGESASRAAGFGTGMAWDAMPGCAQLAVAADAAVDGGGPGDWFGGVADHELVGLVCAWDRVEAHAAARKLAAVAEVFRRNPEDGFEPGPGQMPGVVHEFTRDQLALALGESRAAVDWLLTVAWHLATRLGGTLDALAGGVITRPKAEIIVRLTQHLDDDEAGAAEAKVLDRAGRLTPGGLRAAVARAVIEVAPETARERRETAARFARVERWAEDSGNAALMGRELPPDEVLAADQQISWWAGELKRAGLDGGMDELRARAFLDLVLGTDSRPRAPPRPRTPPGRMAARRGSLGCGSGPGRCGRVRRPGHPDRPAGHRGRPGGPAGRAGRAGPGRPVAGPRPGRRRRAEPGDDLVRDGDRRQGHAAGHGCARPEPASHARRAGPGPPGGAGFCFTPASRDGPPGGYGTWRLRIPGGGPGPDRRDRHPRHPTTAGTGTRPGATTPGSSCGTCPRSGTPPAPARSAGGPPPVRFRAQHRRTRRAAGPACATGARNAGMTTGSSSSPGGQSLSSPAGPSAGPPRPGAATTPNPPATPPDPRTRHGPG